jgi:CRP-like cAMP-binding protein
VAQVAWEVLRGLLATDHALALAWLEDLALQFLHTADAVKQVAFGGLPARIANVLLSYADAAPEPEADPQAPVSLDINHHQLAQHVASPRRSVIRVMQQLHRGLVTADGGRLRLRDRGKLAELLCGRRLGLAHRGRRPAIFKPE